MITGLRIVGLDLSLTSTGASDGYQHAAFGTSADAPIEERLHELVGFVTRFTAASEAVMAVIEAPAFSRNGPGHDELSALRLMVRHRLWRNGIPFAMVPPSTLKKFTTGYGLATKQEMVAVLDERYGTSFASVSVKDGRYDQADAFALAAMGYEHVGRTLAHHANIHHPDTMSLDKVAWPELVSD